MKESHVNTLMEAIQVWSEEETDVVIVSREGWEVPAHRLILSLFSPQLKNLLKSSPLYIHSTLYIPDSSYDSISNVLKSIYSGVNQDLVSLDQQEFEETFQLLGFDKPISRKQSDVAAVIGLDIAESSEERLEELKRTKPKTVESQKITIGEEEDTDDELFPGKTVPLLNGCLCRSYNPFLPTISCKNKSCKIKTFHLACLNLKAPPKGKWQCKDCTNSLPVSKCEICPYDTPHSKSLLLHYANQHFKTSLMELIDVFFKGNQCFHCDKEVYHNGDNQKIIHIGIKHGKIRTILNKYGINLKLKVPKSRQSIKSSQLNVASKEISQSLESISCEMCDTVFNSSDDLLSHQATVHFKSEISKLLRNYFLYQENYCRRCPGRKALPGITNKIVHVGTVHGACEKLVKDKKEAEKDKFIVLNEDVIKEEEVEVLEIKTEY